MITPKMAARNELRTSRSAPHHSTSAAEPDRSRSISLPIAEWFERFARPLPWRSTRRNPYRSLVSEFMLQQTQVSRVLGRFEVFVGTFPTIGSLARAAESDVLAAWSGLGYYRRARLLHTAARCIVDRFNGEVPADRAALLSIPGIGPYTAGAIASIVHGRPEPIVDGNVIRVLCRVHGREVSANEPRTVKWCWEHAAIIARSADSPALTNEGIMELGATICTPRNPRCESCPLRDLCVARRTGRQDEIPKPKRVAARRVIQHASVIIADSRGRVLVEQRPNHGLWASMWQAPTLERENSEPITATEVAGLVSIPRAASIRLVRQFRHATSHRQIEATVWRLESPTRKELRAAAAARHGSAYLDREAIAALAVSNLQRRVIAVCEPQRSPDKSPRAAQKPGPLAAPARSSAPGTPRRQSVS